MSKWQELIDAGIDEQDIEQRLLAGVSLDEQVRDLRAEQFDEVRKVLTEEEAWALYEKVRAERLAQEKPSP